MGMHSEAEAGEQGGHRAARRALRWPVLCWTVILLLIGTVQIVRAEWFDAVLFFAAAALVAASAWLPLPGGGRISRGALLTGTVLAAGALALLPRHGVWMGIGVGLVGVAAIALSWPGAPSRGAAWTTGLRRLAVGWAAILVAGCLWELAQFIVGRLHPEQPSYALSDLLDPLIDTPVGKAAFVAAWLAAGLFLVRRGGRR